MSSSKRMGKMELNLKLLFLLNMNRINDAIYLLKSLIYCKDEPDSNAIPELCQEVIEILIDKVNNENDSKAAKEMKMNLKNIFMSLDQVAELTNNRVQDFLSASIDLHQIEKKKLTSKESLQ